MTGPRAAAARFVLGRARPPAGRRIPGVAFAGDAMDRLKQVLAAGITQFVDLTDATELPSYEGLLPFATPSGRRVQYMRESIPDHGVPGSTDTMERIVATLRNALDAGEVVYLHCRAGIGRSAMVAGCYLVERGMGAAVALEAAADMLATEREVAALGLRARDRRAVRIHPRAGTAPGARRRRRWRRQVDQAPLDPHPRCTVRPGRRRHDGRGMHAGGGSDWTQHTALAFASRKACSRSGSSIRGPDGAVPALEARRNRPAKRLHAGLGMMSRAPSRRTAGAASPIAGSHDPRDHSDSSLTRACLAALALPATTAAAVALAADARGPLTRGRSCSMSAVIWLPCSCGVEGAAWRSLEPYEPSDGLWAQRPLKREVEEPCGGIARGIRAATGRSATSTCYGHSANAGRRAVQSSGSRRSSASATGSPSILRSWRDRRCTGGRPLWHARRSRPMRDGAAPRCARRLAAQSRIARGSGSTLAAQGPVTSMTHHGRDLAVGQDGVTARARARVDPARATSTAATSVSATCDSR